MIVSNALADERFSTNPLVTSEPHIEFYAGVPLITPAGLALEALCAIDRVPCELSNEQISGLRALAHQVITQIELRRHVTFLARTVTEFKQAEKARIQETSRSRIVSATTPTGVLIARFGDRIGNGIRVLTCDALVADSTVPNFYKPSLLGLSFFLLMLCERIYR